MIDAPELAVTLPLDLLRHLRAESRRLEVPLEWLIAAVVVETMEPAEERVLLRASA